ncbi:MAG: TNT domain-containing protein [Lachnospiraceae bacterium]|nr:TNT domain-containing protein [Lachnospiraceae bacterium]
MDLQVRPYPRKGGSSSKYYNSDGSPIWPPNRGFDGSPTKITLETGTLIDRYGYDGGTFASPRGIPYTERALPIGTDQKPYTVFEVVRPVDVQAGKIAPWFGEKGGGIQYEFSQKISELLQQGILRKV